MEALLQPSSTPCIHTAPDSRRAAEESRSLNTKKSRLPTVQYLRGLAALMVVFTHTGGTATIPKYFGKDLFAAVYQGGAVGVHLFFVISGFIVAYVSLSTNTLARALTPKTFFRRRFIRIVPFMWICVVGHGTLMFLGRDTASFPVAAYIRSLFLFPVGEVLPNVTWTLRHEMAFYLVFGFSLLFSTRRRTVLIIWIVSPLLWLLASKSFPQLHVGVIEMANFFFSSYNLLFGFGVVIGLAFLRGRFTWRWQSGNTFLICAALCVGLLFAANCLNSIGILNKLAYNTIIGGISACVLVCALLLKPRSHSGAFHKMGLLLGDASYSIYLTHSAVISCIFGVWAKFEKTPNPVLLAVVTAALCCLGGVLVHRVVEKPLIKFLRAQAVRPA